MLLVSIFHPEIKKKYIKKKVITDKSIIKFNPTPTPQNQEKNPFMLPVQQLVEEVVHFQDKEVLDQVEICDTQKSFQSIMYTPHITILFSTHYRKCILVEFLPVHDHGRHSHVVLNHDFVDPFKSNHFGFHDGVSDGIKICRLK